MRTKYSAVAVIVTTEISFWEIYEVSLISGFEHIVQQDVNLAPFTRLNIGGAAQYFAEPTSRDELQQLVQRFSEQDQPIRLIGRGSNLLVPDEGITGLVIHLNAPEFTRIEVIADGLSAGGGAALSHFISTAVREGFSGPEQLAGLPGTIGGALHNNTGDHGVDFGSWVHSAEVMTRSGEIAIREKENMSFAYHQSSLSELVILNAKFLFEKEDPESLTKKMQKTWIVRRAKQPASDQRAVYMFQDVGGETASSLIEQAGLKGQRVGDVTILDSEPNFLVADGNASSNDVRKLIDLIKEEVQQKLDVEMTPAIQIW